jgi:hypothetical protein
MSVSDDRRVSVCPIPLPHRIRPATAHPDRRFEEALSVWCWCGTSQLVEPDDLSTMGLRERCSIGRLSEPQRDRT